MDEGPELRTLQSRLVAAALADRRRIERALHDGAQQDLIAISVDVMLSLSYESDATYREAVTAVGRFRSARARP